MKLKIKITKDVIQRSMWCGTKGDNGKMTSTNCAVALALRDVFGLVRVDGRTIWFWDIKGKPEIPLPQMAKDFINQFDGASPVQRRDHLPELEFEIDLPKEVIDAINIDDIARSETLQLV